MHLIKSKDGNRVSEKLFPIFKQDMPGSIQLIKQEIFA